MSTPREQGALVYVVSRSGKVLGSEDRSQAFVEADYFEGELEGWIFWGSSISTSKRGDKQRQDVFGSANGRGFIRNAVDSLGVISWKKKIPFCVWGDETASFNNVFSPWWRQTRCYARKSAARKEFAQVKRNEEVWEDPDSRCKSPLPGSPKPQVLFRSDRGSRMEQNLKIGLAQFGALQKLDGQSRWEPGSRELAARWAAWLLKMLRKSGPQPFQLLLFTMCSAVLPAISCSLVREQWTRVPDLELFRCADIVWSALGKSYACFSPAQWKILEERLNECRQLRLKLASTSEKDSREPRVVETLEEQRGVRMLSPTYGAYRSFHQRPYSSRDEKLSDALVENEGIPALVKRALQEKLFTPLYSHMKMKEAAGVRCGSGTIASLVCPLSGKRVKVPARGRGCTHLTCFDLQAFLQGRVKDCFYDTSSSMHQQKKPKIDRGPWCCPICGSDATWPQIVVDRLLLRILEFLPEHILQVCLLPNGRWHMIWGAGWADSGKIDVKSPKVAIHTLFKAAVGSEICRLGQTGELRRDTWRGFGGFGKEESRACVGDLHNLNRAYGAWKDGGKVDSREKIEVQWGPKSTLALCNGDQNSDLDSLWESSTHNILNIGDSTKMARRQQTRSIINAKVESDPPVAQEDIVKTVSEDKEKLGVDGENSITTSHSNLILEALQALGGITTLSNGGPGAAMCNRVRLGQPKARRKVMAKKI